MTKAFFSEVGTGSRQENASKQNRPSRPIVRRAGPVRLLVVGCLFLIAAIAIGTMASIFRERALSPRRELENTVRLLTRHFDQQFRDFGAIQQGFVAFVRSASIGSKEWTRDRQRKRNS
jgi:hypothetical protein